MESFTGNTGQKHNQNNWANNHVRYKLGCIMWIKRGEQYISAYK